jgi:hypothetical protein
MISLDKDSPNTNAILGALLSGGDVEKLAKILVKAQDKKQESSNA